LLFEADFFGFRPLIHLPCLSSTARTLQNILTVLAANYRGWATPSGIVDDSPGDEDGCISPILAAEHEPEMSAVLLETNPGGRVPPHLWDSGAEHVPW